MTVISFISRSVMVLIWTFTDTHKHTHINNLSLHHEVCSSFYYFGFGFCLFIKSYFYDIALKSSQLSDKMSKPHTESSFNIILFFIIFDLRYDPFNKGQKLLCLVWSTMILLSDWDSLYYGKTIYQFHTTALFPLNSIYAICVSQPPDKLYNVKE